MTGTGATRRVASVTITNPGSGYSGTATIHFSTGTAAANVNLGFSVASVTVTNSGSGYTSAPTVLIGILLRLAVSEPPALPMKVQRSFGVTITNPRHGLYLCANRRHNASPVVAATAQPQPLILTKVVNVTLTAGGSGYSSAPQVQFVPS